MSSSDLKLAWRNLGRNRRRTLITGVALVVGMSLCVATYGLMDGMNADILRSLTRLDLGHAQVHHPEYPRRRTLKHVIPDALAVQERARALPELEALAPRALGFGLASAETKSAGVQLVGVDPELEPRVTELHQQIVQGRYLDRTPTPWPRGRALTEQERRRDERVTEEIEETVLAEIDALDAQPDPGARSGPPPDAAPEPAAPHLSGAARSWTERLAAEVAPPPEHPPRVIIGASLARILGARVGQRIYVMSSTRDGLAAETQMVVAGIFRTGTDSYDRTRVYLHLQDLQRFLRLGDGVHELALTARSPERAGELARALERSVDSKRVLVQSWQEIRPDIQNMIQLNQVSTAIMVLIIFLVAALGVVNTMLMAVFERTREIGMLKAIGMSGGRIVRLILAETLLLVIVASVVGVALGVGLDLYMIAYGVDLSSMTGGISLGGLGVSPVIHGALTAQGVLVPLLSLSFMCFVAAFYPAVRAARMRPAQGMREA